ncbi:MAG: hypothetical protein ABW022_08395 [Actinoplanes sp.]
MTFRVGGSWNQQTIILEGVQPSDDRGRRPDDQLVGFIDSAAPEGLAELIVALLNGDGTDERCQRLLAANRKLVTRLAVLEDIENERDRALGQLEDAQRELVRRS